MKKLFVHLRKYIGIYGFVLVWLAAFAFRNAVAERDLAKLERATGAPFAPFLVESAIMYGYINDCAAGKPIAGVDPALPAMRAWTVSEQMSLGLEYAGGTLLKIYRAFAGAPPAGGGEYETSARESRFLRLVLSLHLAEVPALVFVLLLVLGVPWPLAMAGAAVEIFSAAALGRYTGQDLIKGAFAFPFLAAWIAAAASALRKPGWARRAALAGAGAAGFVAVAGWDASQLVIGGFALLEIGRLAWGGKSSRKRRDLWLTTYIALILAAVLLPYHRVHGFFFSPVMQFCLPGALLLNWLPCAARADWLRRLAVLLGLVLWSLAAAWLSPFAGNYEHFAGLLAAKFKFWNQLPSDPTLLTFDQRYLWTPELHSADWKLTRMIFPAALPALAGLVLGYAGWYFLKSRHWSRTPRFGHPAAGSLAQYAVLTLAAFGAYLLMARFRDLTALLMAPALGLACWAFARETPRRFRWVWLLLPALLAGLECVNSMRVRRAYPEGLDATAALVRHLRQYDLSGQTVLADMQNSPLLKGYCRASILIQPKYELPEVRRLTREYLETYFNAPLAEFERFCAANQVDYVLVHVPLATTPANVRYSYRYMTCTARLRKNSAAAVLSFGAPGMAPNFCEVPLPAAATGIRGYRLYRFVAPAERRRAIELTDRALEAYYLRKPKRAKRLIQEAYAAAPGLGEIYEAYTLICRAAPPAVELPKRQR